MDDGVKRIYLLLERRQSVERREEQNVERKGLYCMVNAAKGKRM